MTFAEFITAITGFAFWQASQLHADSCTDAHPYPVAGEVIELMQRCDGGLDVEKDLPKLSCGCIDVRALEDMAAPQRLYLGMKIYR